MKKLPPKFKEKKNKTQLYGEEKNLKLVNNSYVFKCKKVKNVRG